MLVRLLTCCRRRTQALESGKFLKASSQLREPFAFSGILAVEVVAAQPPTILSLM